MESGHGDRATRRHGDLVNTEKAHLAVSKSRQQTKLIYAKHPRVSVSPRLRVGSSSLILVLSRSRP